MSAMIEIEGLGKQYSIRHESAVRYETLRESLMHGARVGSSTEATWTIVLDFLDATISAPE